MSRNNYFDTGEGWGSHTHKEFLYVDGMVDGFKDECKFDSSKPSAIPRKLIDVAKLNNNGWKVKVGLDARERCIRKAGRPQKIIENVDECFSDPNASKLRMFSSVGCAVRTVKILTGWDFGAHGAPY